MTRRFLEIDVLKALGIVTVVLIHGVRPPWDPALSAVEIWLGHLTRFGVPAFVFASGYLYATRQPVPADTLRRRLRRILVPYVLASLGAQVWWAVQDRPTPGGSLWADLLFGASFGPYYYVFVIALLVAATPLLARLPEALLLPGAVLLLAVQWAVDAAALGSLPFFWHVRNPLLWGAYFTAGWLLRLHREGVAAWIQPRRTALGAALTLAVALLTAAVGLPGPWLWVRSAAWLHVWAVLALVFVLCCDTGRSPGPLRWISDATYGIYLFHLFALYGVQLWLPPPGGDAASILLPWLGGLAGSTAFVWLAQRLLGTRSRDLIGA